MGKIKGWTKLVETNKLIVYGCDKNKRVLRLHNWDYGQWAIDLGLEVGDFKYEWTMPNYYNGSKEDAKRVALEYMRSHPNG